MEQSTLQQDKQYKDINQDEFLVEVVEESKNNLIVVDFWAPWCGPCKELGPRIEKVIKQTKNKVKLVKINLDENQELAAQLQIQSIPTVLAFKNGKIVNAFQGALQESEIIKFVEKSLGEKLEENFTELINEARDLLNTEKYEESLSLIENVLSSDTKNAEAIEILIKNNIGLGKHEETKEIIESLTKEMLNNKKIKSAINSYNLFINTKKGPSIEELLKIVGVDPLNIENVKNLSDLYFSKKNYSDALSVIIDLYIKLKKEDKEKVKNILFGYFEILGDKHEETKKARRKLSSVIFS